MKRTILITVAFLLLAGHSFSQVLWTPGGTVGNNVANQYVGIGTSTPGAKLTVTQTATATGALQGIVYTGAINTNQTLSTEIPAVTITTAGRQWATGNITLQREVLITQPTYSFVGASTITDAATIGITGAPVKSTNATITNTHGLLIQAGAVSTATNSYGLTVNAQTGATNNYSAAFLGGKVGIGTTSPSSLLTLSGASANVSIIGSASSLNFSTDGAGGGYGDLLPSGSYIFGQTAKNTSIITTGQGAPGSGNWGKISLMYRRASSTSYYYSALEFSDVNTGYSNLLLMKSGGNVGIGNTAPRQKLSVTGSGRVTDSLYLNKYIPGTSDSILVREGNVVKYKLLSGSQFWTRNSGSGYLYPGTLTDKVGIGFNSPVARLDIRDTLSNPAIIVRNRISNDSIQFLVRANGYVEARDVLVRTGLIMPDYVFEKDYKLMSLNEVEKYINENKHLPDVPSAIEICNTGLNLVEMDAALLKKIEELTLYVIELKKENEEMKNEINLLKQK